MEFFKKLFETSKDKEIKAIASYLAGEDRKVEAISKYMASKEPCVYGSNRNPVFGDDAELSMILVEVDRLHLYIKQLEKRNDELQSQRTEILSENLQMVTERNKMNGRMINFFQIIDKVQKAKTCKERFELLKSIEPMDKPKDDNIVFEKPIHGKKRIFRS